MGERRVARMAFGPGLDRDTGAMAVKAGSMEDLRDVFLRHGRLTVRKGNELVAQLQDPAGNPVSHVLAGQPLRGQRVGLVVGYQGNDYGNGHQGKVWVYEASADGQVQRRIDPEWFTQTNPGSRPPPTVSTASSFGRAFFAHVTQNQADRAPTAVYDPFTGATLEDLTSDVDGDGSDETVAFRGVVSHLDYLFGWGFGTPQTDRAELVRVSLPGAPKTFEVNDYFIPGSRKDPTVACVPAGGNLMVLKESETHRIHGSGRSNFGIRRLDERFGCVATRLAVTVQGTAFFWGTDGPRVTKGEASQRVGTALDLEGFDPPGLADKDPTSEGFAAYVPEEQVVVFCFGKRVYALTTREEARGWSYWELPFSAESGFTLYGSGLASSPSTDPPPGQSDFKSKGAEPASDTSVDLSWANENVDGDELVEVWRRHVANMAWPEWLYEPTDTGGTSGVADGWTDGGAATANFTLDDEDGDGTDDRQRIEVTGGAAGEQAYTEKIIGGVSQGDVIRASSHHLAANLTDLEGRIEIAFRDGGGTVLQTKETTQLTDSSDGRRGYVEDTAPANTADVRIRLIAHVTGSSPSGSIYWKRVLVDEEGAAEAWSRADSLAVTLGDQTYTLSGNKDGWFVEVALRHRRSAQYGTNYQSSDPNDWPAVSKALGKNTISEPTVDAVAWDRVAGDREEVYVTWTANMPYEHEILVGGSTEETVSNSSTGQNQTTLASGPAVGTDQFSGETHHSFEARLVHPDGIQTYDSNTYSRWTGPIEPKIDSWYPQTDGGTFYYSTQAGDTDDGNVPDSECGVQAYEDVDGIGTLDNEEAPPPSGYGSVSYSGLNQGDSVTLELRHKTVIDGTADYSPRSIATENAGSDSDPRF